MVLVFFKLSSLYKIFNFFSILANKSLGQNFPSADPNTVIKLLPNSLIDGKDSSGTNVFSLLSHFILPPQCDQRFKVEVHPPDINTESQIIVSKTAPSPTTEHNSTALTFFFPITFEMALLNSTLIPNFLAFNGRFPSLFSLTSITRGTLIPALNNSITDEYAESLFVKTTTLSPGDTPYSL